MVLIAKGCSKRASEEDFLTFGEFCLYANELKQNSVNKNSLPFPLSRCSKLKHRRKNRAARWSPGGAKYEVFLGGSCNPTTWRVDAAIPLLKQHGISYYNPQVAHWVPELIEMESEAKQNAEVMFFVIDKETRSVASLIEAAQVAGAGRKLALVVMNLPSSADQMEVLGEPVTERELAELRQGRSYLQDLVERHSIPVFNNIPQALEYIIHLCGKGHTASDCNKSPLSPFPLRLPLKMAHLQLGDKLVKVREVFNNLDIEKSGFLSLDSVGMAFRILTRRDIAINDLKTLIDSEHVDFETFCLLYVELQNGYFGGLLRKTISCLVNLWASFCSSLGTIMSFLGPASTPTFHYDIYLGGSTSPNWRQEKAIPMLKQRGLTSLSPQQGEEWSERYLPLEAAALESCRVLLFVITSSTRSLAQMILAAHYIGHDCEVVLCLQHLPDGVEIEGEKLSSLAVKDYNRGRVYLSDLATRAGVPVFEDIEGAVKCAMDICEKSF